MTAEDFSKKVKAKYPQYADIPDVELAKRVIAKHPVYALQVEFGASPAPTENRILGMDVGTAAQAVHGALSRDIPGLTPAVNALRKDIPEAVAETGGKLGFPLAGALAGTAIGTAAELLPADGNDLAAQVAFGPVLKGSGSLIEKAGIAQLAKKTVIPGILTHVFGAPEAVAARAAARPVATVAPRGPEVAEQAVKSLANVVSQARRALGARLAAVEDYASTKIDKLIPVKDIADQMVSDLSKKFVKIPGMKTVSRIGAKTIEEAPIGKLSGPVAEVLSDLGRTPAQETASGLLDATGTPIVTRTEAPAEVSFKKAIALRRKMDEIIGQGEKGLLAVSDAEKAALQRAKEALRDRYMQASPMFKKFNDAFKNLAGNFDQLKEEVFRGSPSQVADRVGRIFKKGTSEYRIAQKVDAVAKSGQKELDKILDVIVADYFSNFLQPGVSQAFAKTGGGILRRGIEAAGGVGGAAVGGPLGVIPGIAAGAALTSPRLAGALLRGGEANIQALSRIPSAAIPPSVGALQALRRRRQASNR